MMQIFGYWTPLVRQTITVLSYILLKIMRVRYFFITVEHVLFYSLDLQLIDVNTSGGTYSSYRSWLIIECHRPLCTLFPLWEYNLEERTTVLICMWMILVLILTSKFLLCFFALQARKMNKIFVHNIGLDYLSHFRRYVSCLLGVVPSVKYES